MTTLTVLPGGFDVGLAWFLGPVLAVAGGAKLLDLDSTRISLQRLLGSAYFAPGRLLRVVAVGLGGGEVLLGGALLAAPRQLAPGLCAAFLCTAFVAAVLRARSVGAACGCFGSLSPRTAGAVELLRAAALATLGWLLVAIHMLVAIHVLGAVDFAGSSARPRPPGVLAGLLGAAVLTLVAMAAGARVRSPRDLRALLRRRQTAGWRVAGPWQRRRVLRAAREHPDVRDVARRLPSPPSWRSAQVRLTRQVAQIVVVGDGGRLHVIVPRRGRPVVVGYTPQGVLTPSRAVSTPPVA
jgi:methylamine utilization protein MauE